ncbi:MAG: PEP-utilizing enzyme [Acidimicrobiales bacterium]
MATALQLKSFEARPRPVADDALATMLRWSTAQGAVSLRDYWFTDHPPSTRFPHYTRANAGEVLATPASPLGQTLVFDEEILPAFQEGSWRMGVYEESDYRDGFPEMCGFFGSYFYINLSCVRMQAVRNPAITVEQLDVAICGDLDVPPYEPHPDDEKPHLQPVAEAHMAFVLSAVEWPELLVEKEEAAQLRASRPDLGALSDAELLQRVRDVLPDVGRLSLNQMVAAGSSAIAPGMLAGVGEAIGDPTIPMRLLAGLGDVDSAAPSFALWELSRMVRGSDELSTAFDGGADVVLGSMETNGSEDMAAFKAAFEDFQFEYGSRGPSEWELATKTWETDPAIVLVAIDQVRHQHDGNSPVMGTAKLASEREALEAEVRAKLVDLDDEELTGVFESALVGGNMMIHRERAKTTLVRALHEVRMALRELGRRHHEAGNLEDPEHIFMLGADELDGWVADPGAHRELLAARGKDWKQLWELEPPFFVSDGALPPLQAWATKGAAGVATADVGEVLTGTSGSPGQVTGTARIVLDPTEPPDLAPGDIMVAPLTDPAWTPLFMAVDGVVVNVGGQISHAVIVSRELGKPCVVAVGDATERIADGATIEVDGASGQVRIVALP